MRRLITAVAITAVLAGCDGENPFMDEVEVEPTIETGVPPEDTVADDGTIFATDINADLTADAFSYDDQGTVDPADDTLRINNIPFDNSDISGGGYTRSAATLPNGFDVYESNASGMPSRQYYAVFQRLTYSEVAAIGTGDYNTFGFGGATAQQLDSTNGIPPESTSFYTFAGDYAAVRITTNAGGSDDVEYITGDATLFVDILDFDVNGAVEGVIDNRQLFDVNGNPLGLLTDFVSLATAGIDFTTGDIGSSVASGNEFVINPDTGAPELSNTTTGEWQGIFAGPNGAEIAGFVVLEGDTNEAEVDDIVRETGVFIVVRPQG
jgi:hypothetical protein